MALGSTEPLTEMSTRNISWGVDAASAEGWQPYHLYMCMSIILKSGSLNFLETTGPVQACNEIVTNRFLNLSGVFPRLYCGLIVNCVKFSPPPSFWITALSCGLFALVAMCFKKRVFWDTPGRLANGHDILGVRAFSVFLGLLNCIGYENGDRQALWNVGNYIYQPTLRRVL